MEIKANLIPLSNIFLYKVFLLTETMKCRIVDKGKQCLPLYSEFCLYMIISHRGAKEYYKRTRLYILQQGIIFYPYL